MKLIDTNRYFLPNTGRRFVHLATVHYGLREFMCFADRTNGRTYIEEITGGQLEFIKDDSLAQGLTDFLTFHRVLDVSKPLLPDDEWLRRRKNP